MQRRMLRPSASAAESATCRPAAHRLSAQPDNDVHADSNERAWSRHLHSDRSGHAGVGGSRHQSFTANPASISSGNASTLSWSVENAQTVTISTFGTVQPTGNKRSSSDGYDDLYSYRYQCYGFCDSDDHGHGRWNRPGPGAAPTLTGCAASPTTSPAPGQAVVISYSAPMHERGVLAHGHRRWSGGPSHCPAHGEHHLHHHRDGREQPDSHLFRGRDGYSGSCSAKCCYHGPGRNRNVQPRGCPQR